VAAADVAPVYQTSTQLPQTTASGAFMRASQPTAPPATRQQQILSGFQTQWPRQPSQYHTWSDALCDKHGQQIEVQGNTVSRLVWVSPRSPDVFPYTIPHPINAMLMYNAMDLSEEQRAMPPWWAFLELPDQTPPSIRGLSHMDVFCEESSSRLIRSWRVSRGW
jgi:hypothetical protein